MSRKKYINAYETVYEYDEKGREKRSIEYRGDYFEVSLDEPGLRRYKCIALIVFGLVFAIQVALGFRDNPGLRILYVTIPYVIVFIPLLYWFIAALRLPVRKQLLRLDVVGLTFNRVKLMSLLATIFLGMVVVGIIVFMILFKEIEKRDDLLFLAGEACAFGLALFAHLASRKVRIQKIDSEQQMLNKT